MNTRDNTTYYALCRARQFLTRHAAIIGTPDLARLEQMLAATITLISRWRVYLWVTDLADQSLAAEIRELAVYHLRAPMRLVVMVARTRLRDVVELRALTVPNHHANCAALILSANTLADVVTRYRAAFEREGLPQHTAARLREGADNLTRLLARRATIRRSRASWLTRVMGEIATARGDLLVLDATLSSALRKNPTLATKWIETKRGTGPAEPECRRHQRSA